MNFQKAWQQPLRIFFVLAVLIIMSCSEKSGDFEALKEAAAADLGAGNYFKAIEKLNAALTMRPSDRDVLYFLGTAYKKLSQFDSALVYFNRGRLLYSNDRPINKELIELCTLSRDYAGALRSIATMISTGDNEKMYWPLLAELNFQSKDYYSAAKYYRLLINETPDEKSYYIYLSGTLAQDNHHDEANAVLHQAIRRFGPSAEAYANIAINFISMKRPDSAEAYMRLSLKVYPGNIPVWVNLANILSEQNDIMKKKEALEIYKTYRSETPAVYKLDSLIPALEEELRGK